VEELSEDELLADEPVEAAEEGTEEVAEAEE
jgi:hypothetical protein